jgi:superoxide dismutase, Fe-Mn family
MFVLIVITILTLCIVASGATYDLPSLPYNTSDLQPLISSKTLEIHHGKHHAKYVNTMNSMVAGTHLENQSLIKIMKESYNSNVPLFNNAAQSWNHSFYWKCMKPKGGGVPSGRLLKSIEASFGSFAEFRKQFTDAANSAFGSGWAWLVYKNGALSVTKTIGADNPIVTLPGSIPILTCDVWEHAYYLDYQNMRPTYVDLFLDNLVNWDYVAENLERAIESGEGAEL